METKYYIQKAVEVNNHTVGYIYLILTEEQAKELLRKKQPKSKRSE